METMGTDRFRGGSWRGWLLGIVATIVASLVVSGLAFQRDTREKLATNEERIKFIETRTRDYIEREFKHRDDSLERLLKRIEALEKK